MTVHYQDARVTLHAGDCLDVLRSLPDSSVDAVVTDPPYGLEFMGKDWDKFKTGRAEKYAAGGSLDPETIASRSGKGGAGPSYVNRPAKRCALCGKQAWSGSPCTCPDPRWVMDNSPLHSFQRWCEEWAAECLRVLRPGGHLLAFGGTRTWHRLACAVEDAGFEIRDSIAWIYGSGFPKSLNVSKALQDRRCRCDVGEYEGGEPAAEHDVHPLRDADVPSAVRAQGGPGAVLLEGVSQQGTPSTGRQELPAAEVRGGEPGVAGRGDHAPSSRELRGSGVRALSAGVPADGEGGRLRDGAPSRDGSPAGTLSAALGSGEPHQPRPAGQPAGEPGAVPVERGSQARRGWSLCGRCGKPSVPDGLGTAAKPAFEPVVVARKPLGGTVAGNVLEWGTGALNIDGCRIEGPPRTTHADGNKRTRTDGPTMREGFGVRLDPTPAPSGRWPANVVLDGAMADALDEQSGTTKSPPVGSVTKTKPRHSTSMSGGFNHDPEGMANGYGDTGGASRFFYVAKAPKRERPVVDGVAHPTVKPLALMRWLVRLVTPPGGTVLEPFAGSGTTVEACLLENVKCIAIEKGDEYLPLILERIRRQDAARIADEVTRRPDPAAAIAEQVIELGLFDLDEDTA